jgi:hypothetical protein
MDNGEVIMGLNEEWNLGGAKLGEWIGGFMMFIIASELFFTNVGRNMPWLMGIWVGTTFGLAALRRSFPDEERGIRNAAMTAAGFAPPGIPAPAALQPYWSGAPLRVLKKETLLAQLGLTDVVDNEGVTEKEQLDSALMK